MVEASVDKLHVNLAGTCTRKRLASCYWWVLGPMIKDFTTVTKTCTQPKCKVPRASVLL